jgi:hypothetical protein
MMTDRSYRRNYLRYPMQYPVIFGWVSCVGEGLLSNLSFKGCSITCDRTPLVGAEVRVSLLLPGHRKALAIEGGTVKWAEGRLFGVEFHHLPLEARQRLNRTLRRALIHGVRGYTSRPDQPTVLDCHRFGGGV